jgi:outer membrane immunogenic protein
MRNWEDSTRAAGRSSAVRRALAANAMAASVAGGIGASPAPAIAADLYAPRGPAPVLRTFDATPWTGGYVGLSVGRSWGSTRVDTNAGNFTVGTNGAQIGGYAGYTWQSGLFVLGGEAELSVGNLKGSNVNISQDMNWMGAVRARAGVLVAPPLYVYGLAGVAWTDMTIKANGIERDQSFAGFQLGAGAEYKLLQNWSLRLDYIYTGLGAEKRDFPTSSQQVDPDFHTVRAGLSFRF